MNVCQLIDALEVLPYDAPCFIQFLDSGVDIEHNPIMFAKVDGDGDVVIGEAEDE